ncbi:YrhB domain-containing protein [Spirosoma sp. SC4-14]|uniref:YrhB domain-containing protein n=1 Tax=Spirosoma sp. SC4-14 TaxID=3128900 RepID=UPI0030D12D54
MLTYEEARELVESHLQKKTESQVDYDPVYLAYLQRNDPTYVQKKVTLVLTNSQEESFGWVFFYNSKEFVETGNISHALGGNSPIIINKQTGELWVTGTANPIEFYIERYRAKIGLA